MGWRRASEQGMSNEPIPDESGAAPSTTDVDDVIARSVPTPTKTPFYQAIHAERYQRQAIIKNIQERYGRRFICYVSGANAAIDRDDTVPFVDLLHNVPPGKDLDLLLHTGGGDIDAAEKLISMVRNKVGAAILRIIVPDFAKSAGTLMVLGADFVVMSDTSELGPIDPQIILSDGNGNRIRHSVQSYLDAYDQHTATLQKDPGNVSAQIMLGKLDPATVRLFQAVKARAQRFAETQLQRGMLRDGSGNWSQAAAELLDTTRWLSHAQMISWEDAQDPRIGLKVEYLDPKSDEWQEYWQLYCLQRLAVGDRQKLYESDYASLLIDGPSS
jgi:ATP-dependent protease ClpP protease subunit